MLEEDNMSLNVLVVDDEANVRNVLRSRILEMGHQCRDLENVTEALQLVETERFDLILTDYKMDDFDGIYFVHELKEKGIETPVVMMTAYATIDKAVSVIKEGAYDFVAKPFNSNQLRQLLQNIEKNNVNRPSTLIAPTPRRAQYFTGMRSQAMEKLQSFIAKVSPTDATILLTGESGTGKSHLAKEIHDRSRVHAGPFVEVHCTTLPNELIESELFGHEKGSFTGATKTKKGKIQEAEKGTLFLDEIGELPPSGQAKLLRFIQEKHIDPVGSNKSIFVDTRIVAATNKDLLKMVKLGHFREDLYYRLNMFECLITPLRERKEDVPVLIEGFIREMERANPEGRVFKIEEELRQKFYLYEWPGNVRELKNTIERLCYLSEDGTLREKDLPENYFGSSDSIKSVRINIDSENDLSPPVTFNNQNGQDLIPESNVIQQDDDKLESLEDIEKSHIKKVLERVRNLDKASEILGITTVTLWRKRKQYGIA